MYRIRIRESVIRGRGLGGVLSKSGKSLKRSEYRVLGLGYRKSRSDAAIEHKTQGAEKHRRSQCTEVHQWTQGWRRTCQDAMPASRGRFSKPVCLRRPVRLRLASLAFGEVSTASRAKNRCSLQKTTSTFRDRLHYLHSGNVVLCQLDQFSVLRE